MSEENKKPFESAFVDDVSFYNKELEPTPVAEKQIGVDTHNEIIDKIADGAVEGIASTVDLSSISSLSNTAQTRDQIYTLIDTMAQDPTVSAALEIYAEDCTQYNDDGKIMWATSDDARQGKEIAGHINYLLDVMNVDKNIYSWAYSLVKYGDLYLRLFRESDYDNNKRADKEKKNKDRLNEDLIVTAYAKTDPYSHYVEAVANPAEMFELVKYGKTYGYVQADVACMNPNTDGGIEKYLNYKFSGNDVTIHAATDFVHASLIDGSDRCPEKITLFTGDADDKESEKSRTYNVRSGRSLLYNLFKIWREIVLLENSMLLNRLTKSSTTRIVGVRVGNMGKEQVPHKLQHIKQMMEQKSALNVGNSLSEYTNPGPVENNIYIPIRDNNQGSIEVQTVGGEVNPGQLTDVDYFKNKFYSGLRVPKTFLGDTEDSAGFNGGASLSIISSRYARAVKRYQNTLIQMITDAVNLMLLDAGLDSYVNKFQLHLTPPPTQEEIDRREATNAKIGIISDIMTAASDVDDPALRVRLLKALLSDTLNSQEINDIFDAQIDLLNAGEEEGANLGERDVEEDRTAAERRSVLGLGRMSHERPEINDIDNDEVETPSAEPMQTEEDTTLPNPSDLGRDFTDSSEE